MSERLAEMAATAASSARKMVEDARAILDRVLAGPGEPGLQELQEAMAALEGAMALNRRAAKAQDLAALVALFGK